MFNKKMSLGDKIETHSYLYCQYDKTTGSTLYYQVADNDSRAILNLIHTTIIPLTQSVLLRLGEVHSVLPRHEKGDIPNLDFKDTLFYTFYDKPELVEWSACRFPESKADSLAPLGLSPEDTNELIRENEKFYSKSEVK